MKGIYSLLTIKDGLDKDTTEPIKRAKLAVLPSMVKMFVKLPPDGCDITQEQIEAKTQVGQHLMVRVNGLYVAKAWDGYGDNDGFTFGAESIVPADQTSAPKAASTPSTPVPKAEK